MIQTLKQHCRWFFIICAISTVGCATSRSSSVPAPPSNATSEPNASEESHEHPTVALTESDFAAEGDRIVYLDGRTGAQLTENDVFERACASDFVVIGESHDQASHHRLQKRAIVACKRALGITSGSTSPPNKLVVGLEMVTWTNQGKLDAYQSGEVDLQGLEASLDWSRTWGYAFDLYAEIIQEAPLLVGLNAPRELVREVAKQGVDNVSPEGRKMLPEMDLSNEEHKSTIRQVFEHHHPPTGSGTAFERFYAAQVLWDETMAEKAVDAFVREGGELDGSAQSAASTRVIVLAGNGHVAGYYGIPNRIMRRAPDRSVTTIVPLLLQPGQDPSEAATEALSAHIADIIMLELPPLQVEM